MISSHTTSQQRQCCNNGAATLNHLLFQEQSSPSKLFQSSIFHLQKPQRMCLEFRNAPAQTLAKCGGLHELAFTWRNRKSSAAIQLWINHSECEISATGKALRVCVRERVSHILCNGKKNCIPRNLVRGSLRTASGYRSNTIWHSQSFCCVCSLGGFLQKTNYNLMSRRSYFERTHEPVSASNVLQCSS